jgi:ADP-ribose pyrophosphatase
MVAPFVGDYYLPMSQKTIVLVDQFRIPVNRRVLSFPAGLVDKGEKADKAMTRELYEETGLVSPRTMFLDEMPSSAGLTDEIIKSYVAFDCIEDTTWRPNPNEPMILHKWDYKDLHKQIFCWKAKHPKGLVCPKVYYMLNAIETLWPR